MTVITLLTADELLHRRDDGHRYELVQGELKRMSPSGSEHSRISLLIARRLGDYVEVNRLGVSYGADAGFLITSNPDTVRAPDAAFVSAERFVRTMKYFPGAPDLAIEVNSPNDRWSDIDEKTNEYLRFGTRAVVVVDPDTRKVRIYRKSGTQIVVTLVETTLEVDDVVPGWKLPLSEIFDE